MDGFAALRLTALQPGEEHLADLTALRLDPEFARFLGGVIAVCLDSNHRHRPSAQRLLRTLRARDGPFAGRVGLRRAWIESVLELEGDFAPAKRIGGRVWRQRSLKPRGDLGRATTRVGSRRSGRQGAQEGGARAFSDEVDAGSSSKNAVKQKTRAFH